MDREKSSSSRRHNPRDDRRRHRERDREEEREKVSKRKDRSESEEPADKRHRLASPNGDSKVSSITPTIENKGNNVNRSHQPPEKSSTDAGKTAGGLSLDALTKAKRALQKQKEVSEKLKKINLLSRGVSKPASERSNMPSSGLGNVQYEAIKKAHELAAKMGFQQDHQFGFPGEVTLQPKPAKTPVLRKGSR